MKVTIEGAVFEGTPEEIKEMMTLMGAEIPVKESEEETEITPKFKKGDKVRNKRTGEIVEVYAYQPKKRTYGDDAGSPLFSPEKGFTYIEGPHEFWDYIEDYELVTEVNEDSTPQFKEGDRVKTLGDGEDGEIKAGEIGIIEWIDANPSADDPYIIGVDTDDDYDYFRPQDLELVSEETKPKFKVGDYAKVVNNVHEYDKGNIVKIVGDRKSGHATGFDFKVEFVNVTGINKLNGQTYGFIDAKNIVKATNEEVKIAKFNRKPGEFKKGDIVRVLDGTFSKHVVGDVGEISDINDDMIDVITSRESDIGGWVFARDIELIAPVEARLDR